MNICFFDIESTSKDALEAEIITAYFKCTENDNFHFKSQVDKWSHEAEQVHKITKYEAMSYPRKEDAIKELYNYLSILPNDTLFVCFANTNNMGSFYHYDSAVITTQLDLYDYKFNFQKIVSAHTMSKKAYKMGLIEPLTKKTITGKTLNDFTQNGVYKALFNTDIDGAHDCINDVNALCEIYNELSYLINNNIKSKNVKQLDLF